MTPPLVSIITPVYNGEKYLEESLLSVFSQSYKNWELIVIDDGSSTDACAKICQKYSGKLSYSKQENRGLSATRNIAIKRARGEYLAFIDQDDIWLPGKLEKQIALYESLRSRGNKVGAVYTKLLNIDDLGKVTARTSFDESGNIYRQLILSNMVGTPSSVMIHRTVLEDTGGFDETLKSYSDWELFVRISRNYEIHCLNEYLTKYRTTDSSLSKNVDLMTDDVERVVEMIIEKDRASLRGDEKAANDFRRFHQKEIGLQWKEAAYYKILKGGDGKAFRRCVLNGAKKYTPFLTLQVALYFLVSFFSIPLCRKLMTARRSP